MYRKLVLQVMFLVSIVYVYKDLICTAGVLLLTEWI